MNNEELVKEIQAGRSVTENTEALYIQNLALIEKLVKPFVNYRVELSDLLQEAFMGLIQAIGKYDPRSVVKFMTFASHDITQAARRYSQYHGHCFRLPAHVTEDMAKYKRHTLSHADDKRPALALGWTLEKLNTIQELCGRSASLDEPLPGEGEARLGEAVPDTRQAMYFDDVEQQIDNGIIWGVVNELPAVQKAVIVLRYYEQLTRVKTAQQLSCKTQYVKDLENKALKRLRRNDIIKAFKPFYTSPRKIRYKNYYGTGYGNFKRNQASNIELLLESLPNI